MLVTEPTKGVSSDGSSRGFGKLPLEEGPLGFSGGGEILDLWGVGGWPPPVVGRARQELRSGRCCAEGMERRGGDLWVLNRGGVGGGLRPGEVFPTEGRGEKTNWKLFRGGRRRLRCGSQRDRALLL
jgi:hypothetical protein